jgi:hypothetical protein
MDSIYSEVFLSFVSEEGKFDLFFIVLRPPQIQPRGGLSYPDFVQIRVVRDVTQGYPDLESAINSLPENSKNYSIEELKKHVAQDFYRGFGREFPEHGLVSLDTKSQMERPFQKVHFPDGSIQYFCHPMANLIAKRI